MATKPTATQSRKSKKLAIARTTVKDLTGGKDSKNVKGGFPPESRYTYCGGDGCYKPNPY
jgi:hypothetical protein